MEDVFTTTRDVLISFMISSGTATFPFLKNIRVIKYPVSVKAAGDLAENDGEEEETWTLINGEGPQNNKEIPEISISPGDNNNEDPILTQGKEV